MSEKIVFAKNFRKRFSKYNNLESIDPNNGHIIAKDDDVCRKIYEEVIEWNKVHFGRDNRLSFTSSLDGEIHPTTYCTVFLRKDDFE